MTVKKLGPLAGLVVALSLVFGGGLAAGVATESKAGGLVDMGAAVITQLSSTAQRLGAFDYDWS